MRCALVLSFSSIFLGLLKTLKQQNYMCIFRVCIIQKQTEAITAKKGEKQTITNSAFRCRRREMLLLVFKFQIFIFMFLSI